MAMETDEERLARTCGGRIFRDHVLSLPPVVEILRATGDGGFVGVGTFPVRITTAHFAPVALTAEQVRAHDEGQTLCPHCGNAEGNADRLRCFICNREM